jgi:hypothetical protein
MDGDQYSLNNLRDISIPDPPLFWPPAPGVWVALGMALATLLFIAWRLHTVRKRNAYRKAGLLLLRSAETARDVAVVLKRVAFAVFPREQVASLYGQDWVEFLHESCPRNKFTAMLAIEAADAPDTELVKLANIWIRHHRVPATRPAAT